jgi:hypothetical protein
MEPTQYRIDNIPFFVLGVSNDDVVVAQPDEVQVLRYVSLAKENGHSTVRVILYDSTPDNKPLAERTRRLREQMRLIGCPSEQSHIPGLISVDVPPNVHFEAVRALLESGAERELWDYEEATIAHKSELP